MEVAMNQNGLKFSDVTINKVPRDAHWNWLSQGGKDFRASWRPSLKIGGIVVLLSISLVSALYFMGLEAMIPAAFGAFVITGPLIATLVYGISQKLEGENKVRKLRTVNMKPQSPTQVGLIGFALLFLVLLWVRVATLLYAVTAGFGANLDGGDFIRFVLQTPQGMAMLVVGTLIGGGLAFLGFAISAISIPLAFERDIDALTAMAISIRAVTKNVTATLSWAFVIAMCVGFSLFFGLLPLIVVFPWLGHSTWHAYRDLIE